jgi:hypothetical protein
VVILHELNSNGYKNKILNFIKVTLKELLITFQAFLKKILDNPSKTTIFVDNKGVLNGSI